MASKRLLDARRKLGVAKSEKYRARYPDWWKQVEREVEELSGEVERLKVGAAIGASSYQLRSLSRVLGGQAAWNRQTRQGRTRLSYHNWLVAHDPEFKQWFGDWEAVRGVRQLERQESLVLDGVEELADNKALKRKFHDFGEVANELDGRRVRFPARMAGKIARDKGLSTLRVASGFDRLFRAAVPMYSEGLKPRGKDHSASIAGYHHYVAKMRFDGGDYYVRFSAQERKVTDVELGGGESTMHASFISEVRIYEGSAVGTSSRPAPVVTGRLLESSAMAKPRYDSELGAWLEAGKLKIDEGKLIAETVEPKPEVLVEWKAHAEKEKTLQGNLSKPDAGGVGSDSILTAARSVGEHFARLERAVKGEGELGEVLAKAKRSGEPVAVEVSQGGEGLGGTYQLAWHGTAYRGIEKEGFKLAKIGTGEGAQAYGWGIYFAENKAVAESYRKQLAGGVFYKGRLLSSIYIDELYRGSEQERWLARTLARNWFSQGNILDAIKQQVEELRLAQLNAREEMVDMSRPPQWRDFPRERLADWEREYAWAQEVLPHLEEQSRSEGQLYRVELPENEELLLRDYPLADQPEGLQGVLRELWDGPLREARGVVGEQVRSMEEEGWLEAVGLREGQSLGEFAGKSFEEARGTDLYDALAKLAKNLSLEERRNRELSAEQEEELGLDEGQKWERVATELLQEHGISGWRYLDRSSRADGEGTYNFVIWDESRLLPEAAQIGTTYQLRASHRATERAYGGRAAYDRAKERGATKLSYGQWLAVRTPEFKAWFGDWEGWRAQKRLDAMEPVAVAVPEAWRGLPVEALRKEAIGKLKALVGDKRKGTGFTDIEHPELGTIRVDSRGVRKTKDASADPAKLIVVAHVDSILPQAIYSRSELPEEGGNKPNLEGTSKLLARVNVDGVELVAIFTILREADGHWYYNTVTVHDLKSREGEAGGLTTEYNQQKAEERAAPLTSLAEHRRDTLRRVKPESVSKAVDPETGEPLVVYHGTADRFTVFQTRSGGDYTYSGLFFTDSEEVATGYSWGEEGHTLAVWLKMERPLYVSGAGQAWSDLTGPTEISGHGKYSTLGEAFNLEEDPDNGYDLAARFTTDEVANWARSEGYDGVIFTEVADDLRGESYGADVYVVFASEQVKSATGNRGTFDGADPDITYELGLRGKTRLALAKRQVYEASGVPQSIYDEIEARLERVRARQLGERESRLRLSPAAEAAGAAADEAGLVTRLARGVVDKWAEPVVRRLEKINPVLGAQLRRFEFGVNRERAKGLGQVQGFTDGLRELAARMAQYRGHLRPKAEGTVSEQVLDSEVSGTAIDEGAHRPLLAGLGGLSVNDYEELDLALKNGDALRRDGILEQYGLGEAWAQVEELLADYNRRLREAGFKFGWLENYFPRKVSDLSGLMAYLESEQGAVKSALDEAIAAVISEREKGAGKGGGAVAEAQGTANDLAQAQRADEVARGILEGKIALPDNLRARVFAQVTEGMNRFYAPPAEALSHYIEQASEALAAAALFGEHAQHGAASEQQAMRPEAAEQGEVSEPEAAVSLGALPLDDIGDLFGLRLGPSVAAYVKGLVATGAVSEAQGAQVEPILRARFNRTRAGWLGLGMVKNVTLLTTLGHVTSALSQLGDLAFSLYETGFYHTVSALAKVGGGKKRARELGAVTKEELGIDQIAEGFKDASKLSRAVDWVFRKVGFEHMDRVGKEAIMTAKLAQLQDEALKGRLNPKARAMLEASFARSAHEKIIEDLANGQKTEDTLFLAYSTLANFQPISLSEYPQAYLNHPNGRLLYLLKTFTLKAISALRREGFSKIVHGKTVAEKASGFRNLIWLAGLMWLLGVPTDGLKDLIMGRGLRLDDLAVDNLLKLAGVNRWITWRVRDGHVFQAATAVVGPPMPWLDYPASDWANIQKEQSKGQSVSLADLEAWKLVPIVGRPWYWWVGGGAKKIAKQKERRAKKPPRKRHHWE